VIDRVRAHVAAQPIAACNRPRGVRAAVLGQEDRIVDGQVKSFASAFLQILLADALLFRSFPRRLICLCPTWRRCSSFRGDGTAGISLDVATVLIAASSSASRWTTPSTVHGYLHRIHRGVSPGVRHHPQREASGRAVIAISVVLISQFSLLGCPTSAPPLTSACCARSACSPARCSNCC